MNKLQRLKFQKGATNHLIRRWVTWLRVCSRRRWSSDWRCTSSQFETSAPMKNMNINIIINIIIVIGNNYQSLLVIQLIITLKLISIELTRTSYSKISAEVKIVLWIFNQQINKSTNVTATFNSMEDTFLPLLHSKFSKVTQITNDNKQ